jgi:protein PET117
MYKGVLRDDERRRETIRKRELELQESKRKREMYERVQRVESSKARD